MCFVVNLAEEDVGTPLPTGMHNAPSVIISGDEIFADIFVLALMLLIYPDSAF